MNRLFRLTVSMLTACALMQSIAHADNNILNLPAPESAHDAVTDFDLGFDAPESRGTNVDSLLENSSLNFKLRNFYFNREKHRAIDSYAWAQGGSFEYKLGRLWDVFELDAEYFASFPLVAPENHDGTLLLESRQDEVTALGVVNPRISLGAHLLSAYRQKYNLPYVNEQDSRMAPNTFEGYTIAMPVVNNPEFQYLVGYIDKIKTRNSDKFISMSKAAGVNGPQNGMFVVGARYFPLPGFSLAAVDYLVEDTLNITYGEGIYKGKLNKNIQNTLSLQGSTQSSVGKDLLRGEEFSGGMWGAQNLTSYEGIVLKLAYTMTDSGALMRAPFGSYAGYNCSIVEDFSRAGENALQVGLSYDFKRVGYEGLSVAAAVVKGNSAVDETTKTALNDKSETDLTVDYRVPKGRLLERFWFRVRGAWVEEEHRGTSNDYRIIVNYDIPLWQPSGDSAAEL